MSKPPSKEISGSGQSDAGSVAALRRRIQHQLTTSEQLIAALKQELADCHQRNKVLVQERNSLIKSLARLEPPLALGQAEATNGSRRARRRDAESTAHALEQENEKLHQRCLELEEALTDRRHDLAEAAAEISCLEEQVAHLQSMVDLLCEHMNLQQLPDVEEDSE